MYTTYIGDGDSKLCSIVSKAQPYGLLQFIGKEESTTHITMRMGTGLREVLRKQKVLALYTLEY